MDYVRAMQILRKHKISAKELLITEIPKIQDTYTMGELDKFLIEKTSFFHNIEYIYIVDINNILKGVISIKEVYLQSDDVKVRDIMKTNCIAAEENASPKMIAVLALKYNLNAVPIVDKEKHLLGIIPSHEILDILHSESSRDIYRLAGMHYVKEESLGGIIDVPLFTTFKRRLPWLFIGLLGGIMAANIIGYFEETLSNNIILASFIPLLVYMGDAVGTQMEAFIIRDMALHPQMKFIHYFLRQFFIVTLIGITTILVLFLISFLIYKNLTISLILGVAMFFAILSSVITGLVIPYVIEKTGLDPANVSGPIATIIQDLISIIIYFGVASLLL